MRGRTTPNKLHKRDKRRMENRRDRMREQGIGEDDATRRATREIDKEMHSGKGGGSNSAGEKQRPTKHTIARKRTGSRSNAS